VQFIKDVPALNVRFVVVVKSTGVIDPDRVKVDEPRFTVRVEEPDPINAGQLTAKLPVLNVPLCT
jgi:hypothetical protein